MNEIIDGNNQLTDDLKKKIEEIQSLYTSSIDKINLFDVKNNSLDEKITELDTQIQTLDSKYTEINDLYEKLIIDGTDKTSIKTNIERYHSSIIKQSQSINTLIKEIKDYYASLFTKTDNFIPLKDEILDLRKQVEDELFEATKSNTTITKFYEEMFVGNDENVAKSKQFNELIEKQNTLLSESTQKLEKINGYYDRVFTDIKPKDKDSKEILGLKSTIERLEKKLRDLITTCDEKLEALTDSSLHNAFASRAKEYSDNFQKLEQYSLYCVFGIIADILAFGAFQIVSIVFFEKKFNYNVLIYQFSICFALVYMLWMYNRNQKIAKKLAEEYHHKAALAEAMTGYRKLYELEHDDEEYMSLFNSIKDQLNINPSIKIDSFLNLKSPQEELTETIKNLLSPETLKTLAKELKPYIGNTE